MKRFVIIVAALVMVISIVGSASAANSLKKGSIGLGFDVANTNGDNMISGKYFVMNDLAVLAGFGFAAHSDDGDGTDVSVAGGIRKYLKMDDFAPFAGGIIEYRVTNDGDNKDLGILGEIGAEYFLGKQLSIEGSVGFGYISHETKTAAGADFKDTTIGTARSGISVNYYFF